MTDMLCNLFGHFHYLEKGSCICLNCKVPLALVVNRGDVFFGTASQWNDCFFDYVCLGEIGEYCEDRAWKLEYREEARPS
jgi:hypothetical protein